MFKKSKKAKKSFHDSLTRHGWISPYPVKLCSDQRPLEQGSSRSKVENAYIVVEKEN